MARDILEWLRDMAWALLPIVVLVAIAVGLIVWLFTSDMAAVESFKRHCIEQGGRLYAPDIILCLTDDGRVMEVYP